ncbi:hypothetical protein [Pantoea sp.]|uniref:hypothetical protein n=1 Tax=Pantoea sp. TaxID=69393 RepID=UPI0031D7A466
MAYSKKEVETYLNAGDEITFTDSFLGGTNLSGIYQRVDDDAIHFRRGSTNFSLNIWKFADLEPLESRKKVALKDEEEQAFLSSGVNKRIEIKNSMSLTEISGRVLVEFYSPSNFEDDANSDDHFYHARDEDNIVRLSGLVANVEIKDDAPSILWISPLVLAGFNGSQTSNTQKGLRCSTPEAKSGFASHFYRITIGESDDYDDLLGEENEPDKPVVLPVAWSDIINLYVLASEQELQPTAHSEEAEPQPDIPPVDGGKSDSPLEHSEGWTVTGLLSGFGLSSTLSDALPDMTGFEPEQLGAGEHIWSSPGFLLADRDLNEGEAVNVWAVRKSDGMLLKTVSFTPIKSADRVRAAWPAKFAEVINADSLTADGSVLLQAGFLSDEGTRSICIDTPDMATFRDYEAQQRAEVSRLWTYGPSYRVFSNAPFASNQVQAASVPDVALQAGDQVCVQVRDLQTSQLYETHIFTPDASAATAGNWSKALCEQINRSSQMLRAGIKTTTHVAPANSGNLLWIPQLSSLTVTIDSVTWWKLRVINPPNLSQGDVVYLYASDKYSGRPLASTFSYTLRDTDKTTAILMDSLSDALKSAPLGTFIQLAGPSLREMKPSEDEAWWFWQAGVPANVSLSTSKERVALKDEKGIAITLSSLCGEGVFENEDEEIDKFNNGLRMTLRDTLTDQVTAQWEWNPDRKAQASKRAWNVAARSALIAGARENGIPLHIGTEKGVQSSSTDDAKWNVWLPEHIPLIGQLVSVSQTDTKVFKLTDNVMQNMQNRLIQEMLFTFVLENELYELSESHEAYISYIEQALIPMTDPLQFSYFLKFVETYSLPHDLISELKGIVDKISHLVLKKVENLKTTWVDSTMLKFPPWIYKKDLFGKVTLSSTLVHCIITSRVYSHHFYGREPTTPLWLLPLPPAINILNCLQAFDHKIMLRVGKAKEKHFSSVLALHLLPSAVTAGVLIQRFLQCVEGFNIPDSKDLLDVVNKGGRIFEGVNLHYPANDRELNTSPCAVAFFINNRGFGGGTKLSLEPPLNTLNFIPSDTLCADYSSTVNSEVYDVTAMNENGVDPRTGLFHAHYQVATLRGLAGNGPELNLTLHYSATRANEGGMGDGWAFRFSSFDNRLRMLTLSTGQIVYLTAKELYDLTASEAATLSRGGLILAGKATNSNRSKNNTVLSSLTVTLPSGRQEVLSMPLEHDGKEASESYKMSCVNKLSKVIENLEKWKKEKDLKTSDIEHLDNQIKDMQERISDMRRSAFILAPITITSPQGGSLTLVWEGKEGHVLLKAVKDGNIHLMQVEHGKLVAQGSEIIRFRVFPDSLPDEEYSVRLDITNCLLTQLTRTGKKDNSAVQRVRFGYSGDIALDRVLTSIAEEDGSLESVVYQKQWKQEESDTVDNLPLLQVENSFLIPGAGQPTITKTWRWENANSLVMKNGETYSSTVYDGIDTLGRFLRRTWTVRNHLHLLISVVEEVPGVSRRTTTHTYPDNVSSTLPAVRYRLLSQAIQTVVTTEDLHPAPASAEEKKS